MTTCPSCGRTLADTVKDCPGCGHDFAAKRRHEAGARLIGGAILVGFLWWLSKTKHGIRIIVVLVILIGIFVIIGSGTSPTPASSNPLPRASDTPSDAPTPEYGDDPYQVSETFAARAKEANNANSAASEPKSVEVRRAIPVSQSPSPQTAVEEGPAKALPGDTSTPRPNVSSTKRLTASDISGYDSKRTQGEIDGIYARYGVVFSRRDAQAWADRQPWYHRIPERTSGMAEQLFTEDEKFNVEILAARRDALRDASQVAEHPKTPTPIPPR